MIMSEISNFQFFITDKNRSLWLGNQIFKKFPTDGKQPTDEKDKIRWPFFIRGGYAFLRYTFLADKGTSHV